MKRSTKNGNFAIVLRLYRVLQWDLLLWMSMNRGRMEQNAINYGASRYPVCCFLCHHFKLSLIDSYRPSYLLYLCIVDLQFLCINAISAAQELAILPHQPSFFIAKPLRCSYAIRESNIFEKVPFGNLTTGNYKLQHCWTCASKLVFPAMPV